MINIHTGASFEDAGVLVRLRTVCVLLLLEGTPTIITQYKRTSNFKVLCPLTIAPGILEPSSMQKIHDRGMLGILIGVYFVFIYNCICKWVSRWIFL
jgi:hypothetical protein